MNEWKRAARRALKSGTTASLLSTAAMALAGVRTNVSVKPVPFGGFVNTKAAPAEAFTITRSPSISV